MLFVEKGLIFAQYNGQVNPHVKGKMEIRGKKRERIDRLEGIQN
jgi:hypothetical protein